MVVHAGAKSPACFAFSVALAFAFGVAGAAENPATELEAPTVEVIGTTPIQGIGVPVSQVPATARPMAARVGTRGDLRWIRNWSTGTSGVDRIVRKADREGVDVQHREGEKKKGPQHHRGEAEVQGTLRREATIQEWSSRRSSQWR